MVADGVDADGRFLKDLAGDGFLQAFAGFDEAGQGGIHGGIGEARGVAEQGAVAVVDQHDDGGVGAGEMLGVAGGADHDVAGAARDAGAAAGAAEAVAAAPVHKAAGVREDGGVVIAKCAGDGAQIGEGTGLIGNQGGGVFGVADVDGEDGDVAAQAEEGPGAVGGAQRGGELGGEEDRFGAAVGDAAHEVAGAPDGGEQGVGVQQRGFDEGGVVAFFRGAVERVAGVDVGAAGEDEGHAAKLPCGTHTGKATALLLAYAAGCCLRYPCHGGMS